MIVRISILLLFILLTSFFYIVVSNILDFISPHFQYKRPSGKVVEVDLRFREIPTDDLKERLYYFWGEGE